MSLALERSLHHKAQVCLVSADVPGSLLWARCSVRGGPASLPPSELLPAARRTICHQPGAWPSPQVFCS